MCLPPMPLCISAKQRFCWSLSLITFCPPFFLRSWSFLIINSLDERRISLFSSLESLSGYLFSLKKYSTFSNCSIMVNGQAMTLKPRMKTRVYGFATSGLYYSSQMWPRWPQGKLIVISDQTISCVYILASHVAKWQPGNIEASKISQTLESTSALCVKLSNYQKNDTNMADKCNFNEWNIIIRTFFNFGKFTAVKRKNIYNLHQEKKRQ